MSRIAMYLPRLDGGGAERMMLDYARYFAQRGVDVDVVVAQRAGELVEAIPDGVTLVDLGAGGVAGSIVPLARYLRQRRPTALMSSINHANLGAILGGRLSMTGVRIVVRQSNIIAETLAHAKNRIDRYMPTLIRWLYPLADTVIVTTQQSYDEVQALTGIAGHQLQHIPNPVNVQRIQQRAQTADAPHPWLAEDAPMPVIIGVGRLHPVKDFSILIRAFAQLRANCDARLLILGEGDERAALESLAVSLGVQDDVQLVGFVDNVPAYVSRADVFVSTSQSEGFGLAIVEALACGTPIVSTDCPGGPGEILQGGVYGAMVPVGDVDAVCAAITQTLREPPSRERLLTRGREYDVETIVSRYLEVLLA